MKKRSLFLSAAAVMALSMAGCGKAAEDSSKVESTADSETVSNNDITEESGSEKTAGEFDWDTVMDDFYIHGIKVDVPFSVNSLGDKFELKNILPDYDGKSCGGIIYFTDESRGITDEMFCMVDFDSIEYTDYNDDDTWTYLTVLNDFNLGGITEGISLEALVERFGEPDEKDDVGYTYFSENEHSYVYIGYDPDNKEVNSIHINI